MRAILESVAPAIVNALAIVIPAIIGWLAIRAAGYIKAHTQNARVQGILLRLNDAATTAVESVEQTVVASLQASARDGKLDQSAAQAAKRAAVTQVEATMGGTKGLSTAMQILGITSPADLENLIGSKIEAHVLKMPSSPPTNMGAVVPLEPMAVPVTSDDAVTKDILPPKGVGIVPPKSAPQDPTKT